MTPTDPGQMAPLQKPIAPKTPGPAQQAKADTLRRLSTWKNGVAVASVAGFIAITGVIVDQHTGTTSIVGAANVAQVVTLQTAVPAATAIPAIGAASAKAQTTPQRAALNGLQVDPATSSSPSRLGKATKAASGPTKQALAATPAATATSVASATAAATTTPMAPAAVATATPVPTATTQPAATQATQNGGYSLGNSSTAQQPTAVATVS